MRPTARAARGLEVPPEWYEEPVFYFSNPAAIYGPEQVVDLNTIPSTLIERTEKMPPSRPLAELDRAFKLSASGNSEILEAWLLLAVKNRYEPAFPALDRGAELEAGHYDVALVLGVEHVREVAGRQVGGRVEAIGAAPVEVAGQGLAGDFAVVTGEEEVEVAVGVAVDAGVAEVDQQVERDAVAARCVGVGGQGLTRVVGAAGDDHVSEKGVEVYIEPKATLFLLGTVMDYAESKMSSGFTFNNPNASGGCGCGSSFTV